LSTHGVIALFTLLLLCGTSRGQTLEARVSSIKGSVLSSDNLHQLHSLSRGEFLAPGTEIDTRGGGLLTIGLSDGRVVVVEPGSRIILKDYSFANSVRDLFDILLGRVRVKINHLSGRPNPYRINSPTASIAVRGTEFSVAVDAPGDTRVVVYEGVVEVTSLTEPNQRTLVEPGHGVIVRPNQDILYFTPIAGRDVAGRELAESNDRNQENVQKDSAGSGGEDDSPRNNAGTYQRSIASLVQSGQTPFLLRLTAFPDSYLDSLENPSYATEFRAPEGRILVIPSFTGSQSLQASSADFASAQGHPTDYTVSPQFSFFGPLPGGKTVLGGTLAASRSGLQSDALVEETGLTGALFAPGPVGIRSASDSTVNSLVTGSFVVAHQFGETGRTSIAFGIDRVSGRGSLLSLTTQTAESVVANERIQSNSTVGQTQFKIGVSRNLVGNHKLGLFYRYGFVSASDADRSRLLNNLPQALDSSATSGYTSEIGIRLRGPLKTRLFYGLEASVLRLRLDDTRFRLSYKVPGPIRILPCECADTA
jgi:FecR protein